MDPVELGIVSQEEYDNFVFYARMQNVFLYSFTFLLPFKVPFMLKSRFFPTQRMTTINRVTNLTLVGCFASFIPFSMK